MQTIISINFEGGVIYLTKNKSKFELRSKFEGTNYSDYPWIRGFGKHRISYYDVLIVEFNHYMHNSHAEIFNPDVPRIDRIRDAIKDRIDDAYFVEFGDVLTINGVPSLSPVLIGSPVRSGINAELPLYVQCALRDHVDDFAETIALTIANDEHYQNIQNTFAIVTMILVFWAIVYYAY